MDILIEAVEIVGNDININSSVLKKIMARLYRVDQSRKSNHSVLDSYRITSENLTAALKNKLVGLEEVTSEVELLNSHPNYEKH